jgi:hypothetical protein
VADKKEDPFVRAIYDVFSSPNVADSNLEAANLVDTSAEIAKGLHRIGAALERLADLYEQINDR